MLEKNTISTDENKKVIITAVTSQDKSAEPSDAGKINIPRTIIQSILLVITLTLSVVVMKWMIANPPKKPSRPPFAKFLAIESLVAEVKNHQPSFIAYGTVVAGRSIDLRTSVSGDIIAINENLRVGSKVETGTELLRIDDFNYQGALREAEANLLQTKASIVESEASLVNEKLKLETAREQLKIAETDLSRTMKLHENGTVTQKQVDDKTLTLSQRRSAVQGSESALQIAAARLEGQRANLQRLEWGVERAKRNLENTLLKAPFSGIIQKTSVDLGKLVNANEIIANLYDDESLEVKFTLTDEQFGRLQKSENGLIGRKLDVVWQVGQQRAEYQAKINRIGAEIDSKRGGVDVYASLNGIAASDVDSNAAFEIRPGAFVEMIVPDVVFKNTVKVPDTAVYDGDTVYVVEGDVLKSRKVDVVLYDGENAIIASGLKAGEKILTTRIAQVSDKLKVKDFNEAPSSNKFAPSEIKSKKDKSKGGQ